MEVYIDDEAKLTLHGLQQHYVKLKDSEKNRKLFELLDVLEFNQVIFFNLETCLGEPKVFLISTYGICSASNLDRKHLYKTH